jgi:hypothetical protein
LKTDPNEQVRVSQIVHEYCANLVANKFPIDKFIISQVMLQFCECFHPCGSDRIRAVNI